MRETVLQNCTGVIEEPFPHVNIKGALSQEYYDELYAALPPWKEVAGPNKQYNNARGNQRSQDILKDGAEVWKQFVRDHTSLEFFDQFVELFGSYIDFYWGKRIRELYGCDFKDLPSKRKNKELLMYDQKRPDLWAPYGMNVLHSTNAPVTEKSSTRGPHLDKDDSLTAGLLYMADPDDDAGGNLEIYKMSGKRIHLKEDGGTNKGRNVRFEHEEVVEVVPYEPNRFVTFINVPTSVHGVTERNITNLPRRFVCIYSRFDRGFLHDS